MKELQSVGLKLLHPGEKPVVDIIAIHGLKGDAYRTWTAKGKDGEPGVLWLRDLLPSEIQDARIMSYGYNSEPSEIFASASTNRIQQHAETLITTLWADRRRANALERPIIFVCHSLGGILVKQALLYSNSCGPGNNEHLRSIKISTYGLIFMGTPHMGASIASWGTLAQRLINMVTPKAFIHTNKNLVTMLEKDSETLQNITGFFTSISNEFQLFFFWEELATLLPNGDRQVIVEYSSAVPEALPNAQKAAIHATHSEMCKFASIDEPGYNMIVATLIEYRNAAQRAIAMKWEHNRISSRIAHQFRAHDAISSANATAGYSGFPQEPLYPSHFPKQPQIEYPSTLGLLDAPQNPEGGEDTPPSNHFSPTLSANEPRFIVPYRPNEYFEGREGELERLHEILQNKRRRTIGNASVVVSAMTGGGKTHMVRQYIYEKRNDYPGGIFWVRSVSSQTLKLGFWKVALGLGLLKNDRGNMHGEPKDEFFVSRVTEWFEHHTKWLLILDGADVETDEEIDRLSDFVPGGKDGGVIFTTVNNALEGVAPLGSPEALELKNLDTERSVNMLLHYSRISSPTEENRKEAEDLVELMGHLPLAIHSAGTYIKENRTSLKQYLDDYRKRPKVQSLTSFHIILDQLEKRHIEATNLILVLAFVGQEVPVKMLQWGIRGLSKDIPMVARGSEGLDFNLTIGHLLKYSLVERQSIIQVDDQQRVDTLLLHQMVQQVCLARMKANGISQECLSVAAFLFCHSFNRMASRRKDLNFFVSDYRRFQVHIAKLLEHARKYKLRPVDIYELETALGQIEDAIAHYAPKYKHTGDGQAAQYSPPKSQFGSGSWSSMDDSQSISTLSPETPFPCEITYFPRDYPVSESPTGVHESYFDPRPSQSSEILRPTAVDRDRGWAAATGSRNIHSNPVRLGLPKKNRFKYNHGRPEPAKGKPSEPCLYTGEILAPEISATPRPLNDPLSLASTPMLAKAVEKVLKHSRESSPSRQRTRPPPSKLLYLGDPSITQSPPLVNQNPVISEQAQHYPVPPLLVEHIPPLGDDKSLGSPTRRFSVPLYASSQQSPPLNTLPRHSTSGPMVHAQFPNAPMVPDGPAVSSRYQRNEAIPRNHSDQNLTTAYVGGYSSQPFVDSPRGRGRPRSRGGSSRDVSPRGLVALRAGAHDLSRIPSEAWTEPIPAHTPLGASPASNPGGLPISRIRSDDGVIPGRSSPKLGHIYLVRSRDKLKRTHSPPPFHATPPTIPETYHSEPISRSSSRGSQVSVASGVNLYPAAQFSPPPSIPFESPDLSPQDRAGFFTRRGTGPGFHVSGYHVNVRDNQDGNPGNESRNEVEFGGMVVEFGVPPPAELANMRQKLGGRPGEQYPLQLLKEYVHGLPTAKSSGPDRRASAPGMAQELKKGAGIDAQTLGVGVRSRSQSRNNLVEDAVGGVAMQRSISEPQNLGPRKEGLNRAIRGTKGLQKREQRDIGVGAS